MRGVGIIYQYEYVPYRTGGGFWFGNDGGHREVINDYAAKGWRFVGYIPLSFTGQGGTEEVDLIFEREITE